MATEISNGRQTVKLYRSVNRGKEMYQLAFYQAGRRVQKNFADKSEAKRVAKQVLGELTNEMCMTTDGHMAGNMQPKLRLCIT